MNEYEVDIVKDKDEAESHLGHRERLKRKIESAGLDHLAPHEVLEYLLFYCIPRRDTNALAHELIKRFGSLSGVFEAKAGELEKIDGVSHSTAMFLSSMPNVSRYYLKDRWRDKPLIKDSFVLGNYLCDLFAGEKNEAFYVISLDSRCRLIKADLVYRGTINETPIYPRMIVEIVLKNNASAVVLSHNHPSGNLAASEADLAVTRTMVDVLTALSVKVIDHVIVCGNRFSSMKSKGQFEAASKLGLTSAFNEHLNEDWKFE